MSDSILRQILDQGVRVPKPGPDLLLLNLAMEIHHYSEIEWNLANINRAVTGFQEVLDDIAE